MLSKVIGRSFTDEGMGTQAYKKTIDKILYLFELT